MTTRNSTPAPPQKTASLRRTLHLLVGAGLPVRIAAGPSTTLDFADTEALLAALPACTHLPRLQVGDADSARKWLTCDVTAWPRVKAPEAIDPTADALLIARKIAYDLRATGWPRPLIGVSYSRAHLLWRCDLPPESDLPHAFVCALADKYDIAEAQVSRAEPRLPLWVPLYGWRTTRGGKSACRLVSIPKDLDEVATESIELAVRPAPSQPRPGEEAIALLESQGIELSQGSQLADGTTAYLCRTCPCQLRRGDGISFLTVAAKGQVGLACLETECEYAVTRVAQENWRAWAAQLEDEPADETEAPPDTATPLADGMPVILDAWAKRPSFFADIEMLAPMTGLANLHAIRRMYNRLRRDMEPFLQAPEYKEFFHEWRVSFPSPVSASELLALADRSPALWQQLGSGSRLSRKNKLAVILGAHLDQQIHGVRIVRVEDNHSKMWLYQVDVVSS